MKILALLLFLSTPIPPRITFEIDRVAAAMPGNEAQFTQRFTPKGFKTAQVESGSVIFGKLPSMRFTYAKPEAKTFVFDGTRSWLYVPADKQVTVVDVDEQRRRELPFLVIGDQVARDRNFVVKHAQRGNVFVTTLQPRDPANAIRNVVVTSNVSTHLIDSVEYSDRDGNRTVFSFSGYHPARVAADTFSFVAPAGVQVVRGD